MPHIQVLSPQVIGKIAAGEVIERPASVLKEILENSVDAGAKSITVEIESAGKRLIRVRDDGSGMSAEDMRLAAVRHATSKILAFEDLDNINTFGFRGEALYSISAVSRLSITSCTHEKNAAGHRIDMEGGKAAAVKEAPPVPGTVVEIRDLFFNTPAREKFLKSDPTERAHLLRVAEECALANIGTAFHIVSDGAKVYSMPAHTDWRTGAEERLRLIAGKNAARGMLYECLGPLKAFFSPPDNLVASRNMQFFFVNRRPVSCRILQQAVYKAYDGLRQGHKHPAGMLFLEMPPSDFDVNIHPQKRDVRFKQDGDIFRLVSGVLGESLIKAKRPVNMLAGGVPLAAPAVMPARTEPRTEPLPKLPPDLFAPAEQKTLFVSEPKTETPSEALRSHAPRWWQPPYRFMGQLQQSYLLYESAEGLVVLDQHAAQERILFEQYLRQLENGDLSAERLVMPSEIELPASDIERVLCWRDWLERAGFEIDRFGDKTLAIKAVPRVFRFSDRGLHDFITQLSGVLGSPEKCAESVKRETVAMMACKHSVKAHDKITPQEADRLINDLKLCKDGMSCPHGRPVMTVLNFHDIARKFGRPKAV